MDSFRAHEEKVFGFVAYLGAPTKQQLEGLLTQVGMLPEVTANVIDRLVLMNLLRNTGHHYLVNDKALGELAAAAVEADMIRLLMGE